MIRAYLHDTYPGMNLAVSLIRHPDGEGHWDGRAMILRLGEGRFSASWEAIEDPNAQIEPTFTLGHDEARALLDALAGHYQGASDMRLLRQDRDHERGRVDKLLEVVSTIAKERA